MSAFKQLRRACAICLEQMTDVWAFFAGYAFPKKYTWRWKLDALLGHYEPETSRLYQQILHPNMTIVDIGAHIGYFTRLFSRVTGSNGHVLAFEADPTNFALLEHNTKKFKNIQRFPTAVSNVVGTLDFFESTTNTGCHSLIPSANRLQKISVPSTTLDRLMMDQKLDHVDLIKMDVEGGEASVLQGMAQLWSKNPRVQFVFEYHPENLRAAQVDPAVFLKTFTDRGYTLFAITPNGLQALPTNQPYIIDQESINLFATTQPDQMLQTTAQTHP